MPMLRNNRNFIIAYALLVGLPILGLFGVLKSGRGLAAPISLDGTWTVQADTNYLATLPCGKSLAASDLGMTISQSGGSFTLSLGNGTKSTTPGTLVGTSLKAFVVPLLSDGAACRGRELSLLATVDPKSNPRSLSGTISVNDCDTCKPVAFRALRQPSATKGGL